jgi:hypothetical protein
MDSISDQEIFNLLLTVLPVTTHCAYPSPIKRQSCFNVTIWSTILNYLSILTRHTDEF